MQGKFLKSRPAQIAPAASHTVTCHPPMATTMRTPPGPACAVLAYQITRRALAAIRPSFWCLSVYLSVKRQFGGHLKCVRFPRVCNEFADRIERRTESGHLLQIETAARSSARGPAPQAAAGTAPSGDSWKNLGGKLPTDYNPLSRLGLSGLAGCCYAGGWVLSRRGLGAVTPGRWVLLRRGLCLPISHLLRAYSTTVQPTATSSSSALRAV